MKKLIVVAVIAGLAVVGWKLRSSKHASAELDVQDGKNVLVDRLWVDKLPTSERDSINLFVMLADHKVGMVRNMTVYKGSDERFVWGGGNGWRWPSNGDVDKPTIRIRTCNEDGMDYCMDISGMSRGVKHYGSRKDWVVKSIADEQALAAKLDAPR